MGVCNCSMFCCTLLYVHSSIAIILMGKRELVALLNLSSWCLVVVEWLFLTVPLGCLQFVIVVFPDHTHLLFWTEMLPGSFTRTGLLRCANYLSKACAWAPRSTSLRLPVQIFWIIYFSKYPFSGL